MDITHSKQQVTSDVDTDVNTDIQQDGTSGYDADKIMKLTQEMKVATDHISKHQTSAIIRFLLYRKIIQCQTPKKRAFLLRELFDSIPVNDVGTNMIECDGHKYFATIKPCERDHDLSRQYELLPQKVTGQLNYILSHVIHSVRIDYANFLDEYEYIRDMLAGDLPKGKKDLTLKIDLANTTLYLDEDDPIRMGIFIERDDYMTQIQDNNIILDFEDIMKLNDVDMSYTVVTYLALRSMRWQYYQTDYVLRAIEFNNSKNFD